MSMRAGEASVQPDVVEREGAGEGRVRAVTESWCHQETQGEYLRRLDTEN